MWLHHLRAQINAIRLRLRFLFDKGAADQEMDEELRFHMEKEFEANLRAGMSPKEARRQAHLTFGGVERFKEQVRDARGVRPLEDLWQDLQYTLRQLRRTPLFTAVAVFTLAIGIGANTGVFSVVNGLLLRDRPYQAPDELVHVYSSVQGQTLYATSYAEDLNDLRTLDDVFLEVGAFAGSASRITEADGARMVLVESVTANLFPLLGMEMRLGRGFYPEEDQLPGGHPLTILGHTLWQRRYGGDEGILGQTIRLGGRPFTIIGVAPENFESFTAQGFRTELFVPMSMAETLEGEREPDRDGSVRGPEGTKIMARLREGVTLEQAQGRVEGLALGLREEHPDLYQDRSFHLHPTQDIALQPDIDAYFMTGAALLMGAVGLVLLLACTNLASFLLARGVDRRKEIALRLALGARRGRLVRQLLTETLTLGLLGAGAGILVARWSMDLIAAATPPMAFPLDINTGLDGTVLLFTVGAAALAGILAGLAPALRSTNPDVAPTLKDGSGTGTKARFSLRSTLVAFQIAVSMVLLVTGGLFVRSMTAAQEVDPGFDTREAALLWVDLGVSGIPRAEWPSVATTLKERAQALPGMEVVALSNGIPLSESTWEANFAIPGVEPPPGEDFHRAFYFAADGDYLEAMGITLVAGRGIEALDRADTEPVVVVSEAAAARYWPDQDPLGREVKAEGWEEPFRVVGVARDMRVANLSESPQPLFYFPWAQFQRRAGQLWLVARGSASATETVGALGRLARELNPDMVVVQAKTLEDQMALTLFLPRVGAILLGFFGAMALALASVGLYGVVSHAVSRRTREVGIRMSLGADAGRVVTMVVREAMGVVVLGGLVGLLASLGLVRMVESYLTGVGAYDLVTLTGVPLLLFAVAALSAFFPARRASRVNPVLALRSE